MWGYAAQGMWVHGAYMGAQPTPSAMSMQMCMWIKNHGYRSLVRERRSCGAPLQQAELPILWAEACRAGRGVTPSDLTVGRQDHLITCACTKQVHPHQRQLA
jgi:hypothetical protein